MKMSAKLLALWERCLNGLTGVLRIHFVRGKPTKATIEEHHGLD